MTDDMIAVRGSLKAAVTRPAHEHTSCAHAQRVVLDQWSDVFDDHHTEYAVCVPCGALLVVETSKQADADPPQTISSMPAHAIARYRRMAAEARGA